jgi:hypothetical protein
MRVCGSTSWADHIVRIEDGQLGEIVLIVYGSVALGRRFISSGDPNPIWLLALAAVTGCVWMALARRAQSGSSSVKFTSILALVLVAFSGRQLFLLLVGCSLTTAGFLGIVSRNIVMRGRSGPARTYTGWPAVAWSSTFLFGGGLAVFWALTSRS